MSISPVQQARKLIRQLEEAIESMCASMSYSTVGQIKIVSDSLAMSGGVATASIVFAPAITQQGNGISLNCHVIFAGNPDNPSWDPIESSATAVFPGTQTSTRRGVVTFTPQAGLGAQPYEIGVSILDSTGQVISSDNCIVTVTS
jgi:hypothetical protein